MCILSTGDGGPKTSLVQFPFEMNSNRTRFWGAIFCVGVLGFTQRSTFHPLVIAYIYLIVAQESSCRIVCCGVRYVYMRIYVQQFVRIVFITCIIVIAKHSDSHKMK